ncbi:MAG: AtpZ/AtpI family protein [Minicystis sp.]
MKDEYKAVGSWGTLGLEIVMSVMLGFFGGRWLDGRLGTDPYLSVLGFFFGCGAAVKSILRTLNEMKAITAREEREHGNPAPVWDRPDDRARDEGSRARPADTRIRIGGR